MRSYLIGLLVLLGSSSSASAVVVEALFDFEDPAIVTTASTGMNHPGGYVSLAMMKSGLTATVTRVGGNAFDVMDNVGGTGGQAKPVPWFTKSLDSHFPLDNSDPSAFVINFSQPVTSIEALFGDFDGTTSNSEDDDTATLMAFDGADGGGAQLGVTQSATISNETSGTAPIFGADDFTTGSLSLSAAGIQSVLLGGVGFQGNHSLFWDNLRVQFDNGEEGGVGIPEPGTLGLSTVMAFFMVGIALRLRRRR